MLPHLMRILIATGIYPPDIGGPATYANYMAEEFSKRGHTVNILTYADEVNLKSEILNSKQISNHKFQIVRVSRKLGSGIRHLVYFRRVVRLSRKADVILLTDTISAGFPVWAASIVTRKPYVLKIGGDWVWEQAFQRWGVTDFLDEFLQKRYSAKIEFFRLLQSRVARKSRAVLAPSNYLKTVAVAWGMPPGKIYTIYNNIHALKVLPSREEARMALGLNLQAPVLLSLGRRVPWKGIAMLRGILPNIQKKFPGVILMAENIPKENVPCWLTAADVFLLNTAYEGFSHQLLEAMAAGLPIITTPAGGNKEIVQDGENALLALYNDEAAWEAAMMRLLENQDLRATLGNNAKKTAEKFMQIDTVGETLKVLESAI